MTATFVFIGSSLFSFCLRWRSYRAAFARQTDGIHRGREKQRRHEASRENFVGATYQLFDSSGQRRAQADGHGQWAHRWQAGDIYVEQVRVDLPANLGAGDYDLKVGLFDGIHQQKFEFAAPQGAQATADILVTIAAR